MKTEKSKFNYRSIGSIGNYYGGLYAMEYQGKYYWLIENYDTDFNDLSEYSEINENLYNNLIVYDNSLISD